MKLYAIALVALTSAIAVTQQQLNIARTYVVGEKDSYNMTVKIGLPQGEAELHMKMNEVVKKVYDNGDADVEVSMSDSKLLFMGQEMPVPGGEDKPQTQRLSKSGAPVGGKLETTAGLGSLGSLTRVLSIFGSVPLEVGKSVNLDQTDPTTKQQIKGTVLLESLTAGVAKIKSDLSVVAPGGKDPMKLKSTTEIDSKTSKLNKATSTIAGFPQMQGMDVDKIEILIERIKS